MENSWNAFLKANKGKGLSQAQLSAAYRQQGLASSASAQRTRPRVAKFHDLVKRFIKQGQQMSQSADTEWNDELPRMMLRLYLQDASIKPGDIVFIGTRSDRKEYGFGMAILDLDGNKDVLRYEEGNHVDTQVSELHRRGYDFSYLKNLDYSQAMSTLDQLYPSDFWGGFTEIPKKATTVIQKIVKRRL
jgi:hypothetical protein